ncbi:MAG TPA: zinc ribbon domain-containing protein [Bacteroidales bacterium]|nr:zinc ribbon domain-containing protein [Bacteroidales bacterium]HPS17063.1 zinc ribbon domain-containing protein [Bacteroidales bacterium]
MDNFIEFRRFPNFDEASELIGILDSNGIPYQVNVNDSAIHFDLAASSINPFDKQIIIQIKEEDFEKADLLLKNIPVQKENKSTVKKCPNCNSEVEENFDICWNCQYSFSEKRVVPKNEFLDVCPNCNKEVDASFEFCPNCQHKLGINAIPRDNKSYEGKMKIDCLRCNVPMLYKGNSKFHEGTRIGALGDLFELFTNRESFDLYFCPQCGKIEFFLPDDDEK